MELGADVPAVGRNLDDLDQTAFGIDSGTDHSRGFIFSSEGIVEFVAVAMTLADVLRAIGCRSPDAFFQMAIVGPEPHGTSHLGDILLVFHQVDDAMGGRGIHLAAVGI